MEQKSSYHRYQRQVILKEFGIAGQQKLLNAKVLVLGAGGLGCPALQYLAGAGVGTIGIVDDDIVSLSNLHRQLLFTMGDIGQSKALIAAERLHAINDEIRIVPHNERLNTHNALAILQDYDIILDGTDNFETRYLVNDACVLLNKPFVYGAVSQFEGQVGILNVTNRGISKPINYRDIFPHPPQEGEIMNCAEGGVIGTLPGIIGTMQANEVIKYITGVGQPLIHAVLTYSALTNQVYTIELTARADTYALIPATGEDFKQMDYAGLCGTKSLQQEMNSIDFNLAIKNEEITIIDVREPGESPIVSSFRHRNIPLSSLKKEVDDINGDTIILFCQSGKRSMQAAQMLFDTFGTSKKIYSLKGGIINWLQHQEVS